MTRRGNWGHDGRSNFYIRKYKVDTVFMQKRAKRFAW